MQKKREGWHLHWWHYSWKKWQMVTLLTRSLDWCLFYIPETNFCWKGQKLKMTSPINLFGQWDILRKFRNSPDLKIKKVFHNAKYVVCMVWRMRRSFKVEFCPKNVPKVILLTLLKFRFNTPNGTAVIKKWKS